MNRTRVLLAKKRTRLTEGQMMTEGFHSHGRQTVRVTNTQSLGKIVQVQPIKSGVEVKRTPVSYEPFSDKINRFQDGKFIKETKTVIVKTQLNFIVGSVCAICTGLAVYWHQYGERNKQTLSKTASEIGKGALSDEELVKTAEKLSLNIVHGVLNDENIRAEVTRLLSGVVLSQSVTDSSKVLVNNLLKDENIQKAIGSLLYDQLLIAINHPKIQESLTGLVLNVLNKEIVMDQLKNLTQNLFTSEEITHTVKTVLGDAVVSEYVREAGKALGKDTTNAIILDPTVQANLSAAIYGAITPSLFSRKPVNKPIKTAPKPVVVTTPPEREKMAEKLADRDAEAEIPEPSDF